MRPHSLSARFLTAWLVLALLPPPAATAAAAGDCFANDGKPVSPVRGSIQVRFGYGESAISGFDEFADVSSPARKYRKKTIDGNMHSATWPASFGGCEVPLYPADYNKSGTNVTYPGNPHANNYSANLTAIAEVGSLIRYRATLSGAASAGGPVDGGLRILISGSFGGAVLTDGQTIDLNPANNPVSVQVQCGYVSWQPLPDSDAQMGAVYLEQIRDEWDISQHLPAAVEHESQRYLAPSPNFPLTGGGNPVSAPTNWFSTAGTTYDSTGIDVTSGKTTRTTIGTDDCFAITGGYSRYSGTVTETLSEEDKDSDALARAREMAEDAVGDYVALNPDPKARPTAYEKELDPADLKVKVMRVGFRADFEVPCPGKYTVRAFLGARDLGSSGDFTPTGHVDTTQSVPSGGTITLKEWITVEDRTKEYVLLEVQLLAPCGDREAGGSHVGVGSVRMGLSLGRGQAGDAAGEILLEAETLSNSSYTPAALLPATSANSEVEIVRDGSYALRQLKAPQTLADIVTLTASSYEVRFYAPADIGTQDPVSKIYALSGTPTPFVTYKAENPDTGVTERLKITETRGSITRISEYVYDAGTGTWSLTTGNGERKESLLATTSGADTTKTTTIRNAANMVVSKTTRVYRVYAWGEELISEVLDPDGAALTTNSSFYDNSGTDGTNYGRLKERTHQNGAWERFTYDASNRTVKIVRSYLNAAAGAAENASRVTENTYGTLADADGDSIAEQLTTTIEKTLGTEIGRSYEVQWSASVTLGTETFARRSDIHCVASGAAWNASGNLVTETLTYTSAPFVGRARRVINSDGTATLISYTLASNGQLMTITKTGEPNGTFDDIVDGVRTVIVTSKQGHPIGETTRDIASDLTLVSWTATLFDATGRPTRLDHAGGTYETRDYACCGLASHRDRFAMVTTYEYDDLGRQTHVNRAGITTKTTYDADGRVKSTIRIGTDDSEIIQETNVYDLAGRLTEREDALERVTGYAESYNATTGETTRTTTNPDDSTVIEVSARDGSRLSVSGTAAAPRNYEYGLDSGEFFTKEILVGPSNATTEWVKSYTDFAGRSYKTVYADSASAQSYFSANGQLVRQVDPDGVTTLFAYNARGEQEVTAVDLDADNTIDYNGTDRITKPVNAVTTNGSYTVQRSTATAWETDSADTPVTVSVSDQSADGLRSWQTVRGLTTTSVAVPDGSGDRTVTTTGPDGVKTIQVYDDGLLASATVRTAADVQLAAVTYAYDEHGRLETSTDVRNGATTYAYFADDQIHTITTPDPDTTRSGTGYDPQTTIYHYDAAGRPDAVTQPDATVVNTTYWPTGAVKRTWGSRTYPTEYTYDPQGRVKTLTTWQDFSTTSGAAATTWNYNSQRGWLDNKRYNDNTGPNYTYKPSGRLLTRVWARSGTITATYSYTDAGDLEEIDYSDATPDVTIAYDRLGRPKSMADGSGSRMLAYHASGQFDTETYTAGALNGHVIDRGYDSNHRLSGISALNSVPSTLISATYAYDAASRLDTVTAGTNTATYGYVTNSPLVGTVTFKQGGTTRLTTTKVHDYLNRLESVVNTPSVSSVQSVVYQYNSANQRTKTTREDSSRWNYTYDALGQVTSGKKLDAVLTPLAGHDFEWTYDDIGNRKTATVNSQLTTYTPALLNTYSQRTVPGAVDVMGAATAASTVTLSVDSGSPQATIRQGELFYKQLTQANGSIASIKVTGVRNLAGSSGEDAITEITRSAFVPTTPETFAHDTDGNLTGDARWAYTWDGENRLSAMETSAAAITAGLVKQKLEFGYDGQGRRFSKKVYGWSGSAWMLDTSILFLYEGWNQIAELDAMNGNDTVRTYVWGLDLSGSTQGAGGVGGLLFSNIVALSSPLHAPCFDGNGNVIGYVDMATGAKSATYEYSAFGETLIADGVAAEAMPFRFSTKYTDSETDLLYYGYRYYQPLTGRWLSRDPLEEEGGVNLYAVVSNGLINNCDPLGLQGASVPGVPLPPTPNFPRGDSPGNSVGGYGKGISSAAKGLPKASLGYMFLYGEYECGKQQPKTGNGCYSCVIRIYKVTSISSTIGNQDTYYYGFARVVQGSPKKVAAEWSGPEIVPYHAPLGTAMARFFNTQSTITEIHPW